MTSAFPRFFCCLLFALAVTFAPASSAAPPEGYDFLRLDEALVRAAAEGKPTMIYFGRYGCTTCRKMHAEVFSDDSLRQKLNSELALAYVDTESAERIRLPTGERTTEMQFAVKNRIYGTPTFIFLSAEQKPLFRKSGLQSIEQMNGYGDYLSEGHYRNMSLDQFLAKR